MSMRSFNADTSPNLSKNLSRLPASPIYQYGFTQRSYTSGYPKSDNGSPDVSPKTQIQQSNSNIPCINVTDGSEYRPYAASDPGHRSDFNMPAPRPRLSPEADLHSLHYFIKDKVGTGVFVGQGSRLSADHVQYGGNVDGIAHSNVGSGMPFAQPRTSPEDSEQSEDSYDGVPLTPHTSYGFPSPYLQRQKTPPQWDPKTLNSASLFPELTSFFEPSMTTGVSYPTTVAYPNAGAVDPAAISGQLGLVSAMGELDISRRGQDIVPPNPAPASTSSRPSSRNSNYRRDGSDSVMRPSNYVLQSSLGKRTRDESAIISTDKYPWTLPPPSRQNNPRVRHECKRPFHCDFTFAGCQQTFASKNEWKQHINSQHTQPYYWRCDFPSCIDRKTATSNRKDLFGQHLKRMHGPKSTTHTVLKPGQKNHQSPEMTHYQH
jgi:hypothetical protein